MERSLSLPDSLFDEEERVNHNGSYSLHGIVNHVGKTIQAGHYTAFVNRKEVDDEEDDWIFFDDAVGVRRSFQYTEIKQSECYIALYEWKDDIGGQ